MTLSSHQTKVLEESKATNEVAYNQIAEHITLRPHQIEVLIDTFGMERVAYFLDMGLGKTLIGSEKMFEIGNMVNLLICQKSKVDDWVSHFNTYYADKIIIIDYTKKDNQGLDVFDFISMSEFTPVVIIVNYELAWRRPELSKLSEFTLILDESSMIQNYSAKQSRFIVKKLHENACILLSGTPVGGKFENLWTQTEMLGCGLTKKQFEDRFINFETLNLAMRSVKIVDRKNPYKNIDELKELLKFGGAVFMKTEEVMNLPEQRFIEVECNNSKAYRTFLRDKVVEVEGRELLGNSSFSMRLALRMLASQYNDNKLERFKELLESTSDRVVVFYNFNEELRKMRDICDKLGRPVSVINGAEKDLSNHNNEENSVTFCQYQAGAMGLNLQKANKMIYFSLPERSELFEQSKKRIHRIGQKSSCTYYILETKASIDKAIYQALRRKQNYTDELFKKDFNF